MTTQITLAQAARTLVQQASRAVLATLDENGHPYTSVVEVSPLANGNALLLMSRLAEHRQFLDRDARASITIAPHIHTDDALARPRVALQGIAELYDANDSERDEYIARHPDAELYLSLGDFHFYCLEVKRVRYIAGFGRMDWLTTDQYAQAEPDPVWEIAPGAVEHMNDDHRDSILLYAQFFGGADWATEAYLLDLDSLGMDIRASSEQQAETLRVAFDPPLTSAAQLRPRVVAMSQQAKSADG
ncbi:MAG: DUF2470 domain-containing protein [Pseudomonadota bacterium]